MQTSAEFATFRWFRCAGEFRGIPSSPKTLWSDAENRGIRGRELLPGPKPADVCFVRVMT